MEDLKKEILSKFKYEANQKIELDEILQIFHSHKIYSNPVLFCNKLFKNTFKFSRTKKFIKNLARRKEGELIGTPKKSKKKKETATNQFQKDLTTKSREMGRRIKLRTQNKESKRLEKLKKGRGKSKKTAIKKLKSKTPTPTTTTPPPSTNINDDFIDEGESITIVDTTPKRLKKLSARKNPKKIIVSDEEEEDEVSDEDSKYFIY